MLMTSSTGGLGECGAGAIRKEEGASGHHWSMPIGFDLMNTRLMTDCQIRNATPRSFYESPLCYIIVARDAICMVYVPAPLGPLRTHAGTSSLREIVDHERKLQLTRLLSRRPISAVVDDCAAHTISLFLHCFADFPSSRFRSVFFLTVP
jgi:hypothetical protein